MPSSPATKNSEVGVNQIDQAIALIQQADALFKACRYDEAVQTLQTVKAAVPNLPEVNRLLAQAYAKQGRVRTALEFAVEEYLFHPDNPQADPFLQKLHDSRLSKVRITNFTGKNPPKEWPSISLIMIVRNEALLLQRCLDSVKDIVSEMVIVDTGSTDQTVEIARSYGAQVHFFAWCDDFAAARNESLKYATGDWLLMMDADNWLEPADQARIKQAAASGEAEAYICRQVTYDGDVISSQDRQYRLFRSGLGLFYQGALHESIERSLAQNKVRPGLSNIAVQHIDKKTNDALLKKKAERNLLVIDRSLEKEPDYIPYQVLKAGMLSETESIDEAARLMEAILAKLPEDYPPDIHLRAAYQPLLIDYAAHGQTEAYKRTLIRLLADGMESYWVWVKVGQSFLSDLDNPAVALVAFERAQKLVVEDIDRSILKIQDCDTYLTGLLIRTYFYLGRKDQARKLLAAKKQVGSGKRIDEVRLEAEQDIQAGDFKSAARRLALFAWQDPATARLYARVCATMNQWQAAASWMAIAVILTDRPAVSDWENLAGYEIGAGGQGRCLRVCQYDLLPRLLADPTDQAARAALEKIAARLNLALPQMVYNQALKWIKQGDYTRARAAAAFVVQAAPDHPQARQVLGMLEKLS